jgi:hypothetical protein
MSWLYEHIRPRTLGTGFYGDAGVKEGCGGTLPAGFLHHVDQFA